MGEDFGDLRLNLSFPLSSEAVRPQKTPPGAGWDQPLVVSAGPSSDLLLGGSWLPCLYHSRPELEGKMQKASAL